jgi:hypothetical protein
LSFNRNLKPETTVSLSQPKINSMKSIVITCMFVFAGITVSMAQDKKADAKASTTTEVSAEKHNCEQSSAKACCSKGEKAAADKKACAPECAKKCPAHADAAVKHEETAPAAPEKK